MIEIDHPTSADDMRALVDVFGQVWGTNPPVTTIEMLVALRHAGGYVSRATDRSGPAHRVVGASLGFLARHCGAPALHSHVTAIVPDVRDAGIGRSIKLHQQQWAADNGLDVITWTFDPLVRRNAWFNVAVLGAEPTEYLPSFYGSMTDDVNAGDDSDRLFVTWDVHQAIPTRPRDGSNAPGSYANGDVALVPTPPDVVLLRRTDPAAVSRWRADTRIALSSALTSGRRIVGFTRAGEYVIGSSL